MGENQVSVAGGQPAPETGMRRPEGVIASAPSEARIAMVPTMSSMSFKGRTAQSSPSPSAHQNSERSHNSNSYGTHKNSQHLFPAKRNASVLGLTVSQMMQITGDRRQDDSHVQRPWKYNDRWGAQPILDFVYLGPSKMATDRAFLEEQKITKMISIRDSRFADVRMLMYDKLAASMGIEMECFDVPAANALMSEIPRVVNSINAHMLTAPVDSNGASTGRVFVFCETGNIRSAAVVLAYVMSMYGESMHGCWQFASLKRFCISLDDDVKRMLVSYEQLFDARRDVHAVEVDSTKEATHISDGNAMDIFIVTGQDLPSTAPGWHGSTGEHTNTQSHPSSQAFLSPPCDPYRAGSAKRSIEETMDIDDDRVEFTRSGLSGMSSREPSIEPSSLNLDYARYENRGTFAPFIDTSVAEIKN
ncbi:putative dual specificity protein phosphatase 3 [Ophiostoma piceae UAMH 11346]|uniref:Putative dual specificity protein phosphatase 3 n=1 Tax=Ophiostoma piceae (strain UAMH 11346) TaxID=1262450 RepID=S3CPJ5_OPHP1|nr:putative dual specificity protein phosphatase 3 [Ophiostoma piceae UAMH 11346]